MPSLHNSLNFVLIQFVTSPTLALFFLQFLMNLVKYRQSDKAIKRSIWSCLLYLKFIIMVVLIRYKLRGSIVKLVLYVVVGGKVGQWYSCGIGFIYSCSSQNQILFMFYNHAAFPKSYQQRNFNISFSDRRSKSSTVHGRSRPDHWGMERHSVCQSWRPGWSSDDADQTWHWFRIGMTIDCKEFMWKSTLFLRR